ncbi:NAD(P)-binding protein [Hypoxylon trugodes]|uniref:NAD(P)-binding protein n=1 Tax=Hypoxylon trugodes TaxID=326681 RepID=UPI0021969F61|nr:NAD(P)-binding protein [Hypoxylon trugodes]KAI1393010.1 NAD(P)-binding protein [Hypoxylon trugodes]
MASLHNVLLLGGSGKIAQLLTPLLLQRSWNVTSIIRDPAQVANLQKLGEGQSGKLNVLVRSLEDVTSDAQAKSIIDEVKPDYVVWSAGAGGKGAPERTFKIDRDAASHFIRASVATPTVTKFVLVSFLCSRLKKPSWWTEEVWQYSQDTVKKNLLKYYEAKIAADQVLYEESKKRPDFAGIDLRPGTLTLEPAGNVSLGKLPVSRGNSSRAGVANLIALLLDTPGVKSSWLDTIDGDEDPEAAVKRVIEEGVDAAEGEPFY